MSPKSRRLRTTGSPSHHPAIEAPTRACFSCAWINSARISRPARRARNTRWRTPLSSRVTHDEEARVVLGIPAREPPAHRGEAPVERERDAADDVDEPDERHVVDARMKAANREPVAIELDSE